MRLSRTPTRVCHLSFHPPLSFFESTIKIVEDRCSSPDRTFTFLSFYIRMKDTIRKGKLKFRDQITILRGIILMNLNPEDSS